MKKRLEWKKGLAVLLSACMVLGMVPVQTRAAAENAASGNETQTQAESTESENDVQTEGSASGNESADVYALTEKDGAYYDDQHVKYTLSTDGSNTATVAKCDKNYISSLYSDEQVEAGNGWEITIPAKVGFDEKEYKVTRVVNSAFDGCQQLTKVDFPENSVLTEIGSWAFYGCSLKSLTLPDSLTTIKSEAFSDNVKLQSIYIPRNVSSIGAAICCNNAQLVKIEVDQNNKTYNVGLGDVNCIVKNTGGTLIQGCSTSVIPSNVIEITDLAFCGMDIRNIDFSNCSKIIIGTGTFTSSIMPNDWKIPVCFENVDFSSNLSLKKLTIHDEYIYLGIHNGYDGLLSYCTNLEEVVIPASVNYDSAFNDSTYNKELFGGGCGTENLTVYVGDFSDDNGLFKSLKAHAYEDYTGDTVVKYEKTEIRHYVLRKAYRVQLAEDYYGYTLTKAKGCTTLTPIPGDSVRFVINAEDNYKKNVTVYATDDSGNKTELTKDADGVYTLNNVNESNYKIFLENYGECGHERTFTYTPGTDESGNSIIIKKCNDCGYEESGRVTATWRHGVKNADSIAFYCDNANIKGTYAVTEAVADGKSDYSYEFTPIDGSCIGNGNVTVTEKKEDKVSDTTNGITYSTVKSENDITQPIGNCTVDIYYDSEDNVLHINGSETYVVSGATTADRIVVNNTKPTTLVLNGLDIQMAALPAIDLQGTEDVKIVLADKTENILKSGSDYAALQKNDLAKNTPKLTVYGSGSLAANATDGAGIGAQSGKTASNITFQNATVTANSQNGCGIGNGSNNMKDDSNFSSGDYIINGGKVMAGSNRFWGISGGITVDGGAAVRDYNSFRSSDKFESSTNVIKGFICRYSFGREAYSKIVGDATVDFQFNGDGLEIPEDSTLTIGYEGQIFNRNGTVANYGTFILKGNVGTLNSITNNGIFYNYSLNGNSLKDKVTGSGTLHEDIDHDGLCDICEAHEDIGNVTVTYDEDVTVMKDDTLTLSAAVTPKDDADKEITYQWYESDTDGNYTKISGATTAEYVQKNCSLEVGEHTYRLQVLCDGIIRYIPFTVHVTKPLGVHLAGYSLSLSGNIGVNFYMELSDEVIGNNEAYMNFSLPNGTSQKVYVTGDHTDGATAVTDTTVTDGTTYYVFTCEVAAKEMTSDIKAQIIAGDQKGTEYTYTVKDYADYVLNHAADSANASGYDAETVALVKAMLYYGGSAQKYFDYHTEKLASDGIDLAGDTTKDWMNDEKYKTVISGDSEVCTFQAAYLSLKSTTDICVYVKLAEGVSAEQTKFYINDNEVTPQETTYDSKDCYKLTVTGVKAKNLASMYTFKVVTGEGEESKTATLSYGAFSYAKTVFNSAYDNTTGMDKLRDVMNGMYLYYNRATAYAEKHSGTSN